MCIYIYIYIDMYIDIVDAAVEEDSLARLRKTWCSEGGTIGNPHRAQVYQFDFFEFILSLKSDIKKQFPVEQFEATVSQSTAPSPPCQRARERTEPLKS